MSADQLLAVLSLLVGLAVSILLAGVPWAFGVHGRLTKIESNQEREGKLLEIVFKLERRMTIMEQTVLRSRREAEPESE